jgi:hypothetical protein
VYTLPTFPETAWRGVFKRYRDIIEDVSVAPLPYHYANLLSILSSQMGHFAVLDEGVKTFLNFYIFCYGRTGTKKSTAMDLAHEHIVDNLAPKHFKTLSSVSSAEGLIRTVATPPYNVLLHYDEVKHLFSVASRSGSAIEPVLNKMFGLGEVGTVVRSATESLSGVNYFFNLIVNGTPVHISLDVGEAMFHGGLLNRFLVFAATPSERTLPVMGVPDEEKIRDLCARLDLHVNAWRGLGTERATVRVKLSPEALEVFTPWYEATEKTIRSDNELISDPIQRISVYAKKVAAIFCLWETPVPDPRPVVSAEQMSAAIDVLTYCQASILYMSGAWNSTRTMGARAEALAEQRVEMYLQANGCANERVLSKRLHMSIGETKRAINALSSVNSVQLGIDKPVTVHWRDLCRCYALVESPPTPAPVVALPFEEPEPMCGPVDN